VSGSITLTVLPSTDWQLNVAHGLRSTFLGGDPNIDDLVNDTGLAPHFGDLRISEEFARFLSVICEENGEFS